MNGRVDESGTALQAATIAGKIVLEEAELVLTARQLDSLEQTLVAQIVLNRDRRRSRRLIMITRGRRAA